jgi:hypothetical protein
VAVRIISAAAVLLVTLTLWGPSRGIIWNFVATQAIDDAAARATLARMTEPDPLPASLDVVRAVAVAGRDASYFYEVRVDPADVPRFKNSVAESLAVRDADFSDDDDLYRLPRPELAPGWWRARRLPDPDVVSGHNWCFIFSVKTGRVYASEMKH